MSSSKVNRNVDARIRGCLLGAEEPRIAVGETLTSDRHKDGGALRDFVEQNMTPSQIAEAQKLARECVRKKYKGC